MKQKIRLSVGIPAYNEEKNITHILDSLFRQKQEFFHIVEVIVISDGSTDATNRLVKDYSRSEVMLVEGKNRLGQQVRQNQLLKLFKGDLLAIIEADILLSGDQVLAELVKPFFEGDGKLGMVIGQGLPVEPKSFYERVLFHGAEFKRALFAGWRSGINVYTAGGHSMKVMSRQFTDKLHWPKHVPEDAYTYFRLRQLGLKMVRNPKARAYMRNVTNFGDRKKQVKKFMSGKKVLANYFPKAWVEAEYMIPPKFIAKSLFKNFLKKPFWTTLFLGELVTNRVAVLRKSAFTALYEIYGSSKSLGPCQSSGVLARRYPTITVGIPAYNEEANIGKLLEFIIKQKITKGRLKKIIVVSDGSTDKTEKIARSFKGVDLVSLGKRVGQMQAQNNIVKRTKSDILVLLNGDVLPVGKSFVDQIIEPIINEACVGLVGADAVCAEPRNFIERVIAGSHEIKKRLYKSTSRGNNIYLCHGRARALAKGLYRKLSWPDACPEDAFSYLFCLREGYKFSFAKDAKVTFRSPSNLDDHIKQSLRFMVGKKKMEVEFGEDAKSSYHIPFGAYIKSGVVSLAVDPISTLVYTAINLYVRLLFLKKPQYSSIWDVAESSKRVIYG